MYSSDPRNWRRLCCCRGHCLWFVTWIVSTDSVHGSSIISTKRADSSCTKRRTYFNKLYQKVCHFKGYIILYYIIPLVWWHTLLDGNEIVKIKLKTFRVKTGTQPSCKPRGTCTTTHVGSRVKMCPAFTRCKILEYIQTFEK